MKKILISILIILLITLACFSAVKGIDFLKIKSINDIKVESSNLEKKFNEANELSNKTYPSEVEGLEEAIKKLKISKQEYETKDLYNAKGDKLTAIEVKTYKIHYLWTILGNYRKDRGVQSLNLDLKSTQVNDVYDLQFTLVGNYISITDFLYDLENDEQLNFNIEDFNITSEITSDSASKKETNIVDNKEQNTTSKEKNNQNNKTEKEEENKNDGINLQAKFTVKDVGITLD